MVKSFTSQAIKVIKCTKRVKNSQTTVSNTELDAKPGPRLCGWRNLGEKMEDMGL